MAVGIVGRDGALAAVRCCLDGLEDGARALLIEGEPGIGKTAVWRAALAESARRGHRVLHCTADQAEARLSFAGLGDLVGDLVDEALGALPAPQREALEVALARRARGRGRAPDARALGIALRSLVVELARAGSVVVAIDDLQWLDGATARAVAFAARRLSGQPVAVLATVRVPVHTPDPLGLERSLGAQRLRLGPLSLGALRTLIGHDYARPVLRRIAAISGGNPLFALEIARALGPQPALEAGAPLPVPETLRELVAGRVDGLAAKGREALLAAAALARPGRDLVERATSVDGLTEAEEAGLVRTDDDRIVFAHPLYASAVYTRAAGARRRAVHRRLAELVVDQEERAHHLAQAARGPDPQVAAVLEAGAANARARGAWDTAGELLEQARALTPAGSVQAPERGMRAAECWIHAGDRRRARGLLDEILVGAPRGALRSEALRLLAEIRYNEDSFAEARRLLEEALADADDVTLAIVIELALSYVRCHQMGDFAGAEVHAERALARARPVGGALLGEALAVHAMVGYLAGRGVDWGSVRRSLELDDPGRPLALQMRPSLIAALLSLFVGDLANARRRLEALRLRALQSGDESDLSLVMFWHAWLETLSGNLEAAAADAEAALDLASLTGSESSRAWALAQRALVHAHRGATDGARADAGAAIVIARRLDSLLPTLWATAALGLAELSVGDSAAAWAAVEPLAQRLEAHGIDEPIGAYFLPEGLEALIALGDIDRAESLLGEFEHAGRKLDRVWAVAAAARCRGLLSAARGDLAGAALALERAEVEHARVEMPFELARTLLVEGQVRRRRRERRRAQEALDRAVELFERVGARVWAQRAREERARFGARREPGTLTTGERRVAELAASGLSNKQIASALFVSVHTVEVHLSHAYAKLGIGSRTQLVRAL